MGRRTGCVKIVQNKNRFSRKTHTDSTGTGSNGVWTIKGIDYKCMVRNVPLVCRVCVWEGLEESVGVPTRPTVTGHSKCSPTQTTISLRSRWTSKPLHRLIPFVSVSTVSIELVFRK